MDQQVINLTRGQPAAEAFPTEDLIACAEAALRQDADVLLQYGRSPGYAPLRRWLAERYGAGPDQILVGNSSPAPNSLTALAHARASIPVGDLPPIR